VIFEYIKNEKMKTKFNINEEVFCIKDNSICCLLIASINISIHGTHYVLIKELSLSEKITKSLSYIRRFRRENRISLEESKVFKTKEDLIKSL